MTSSMFHTPNPKMIVPFEWILENVDEKPTTIASKMILFRGEKVFRVGLKNLAQSPVLFFMAINLSQIGMKVEDVTYGIQGSGIGPATMKAMKKEDIGEEESLQLFTITLDEKVLGNCTLVFRICIKGTDPSYSYQLCDRLAKDQLWAALISQQNLADVELIVKDKTFFVHKAIFAARSQVFADDFKKHQLVKACSHRIQIDGVEPKTVEKFLHFIYTGESIGTLADEELLKLAERYGLKTLTILCQDALKKIDAMQMGNLMKRLNSNDTEISSSKIIPEKDTEIFFDRTTPTFRCHSRLSSSETEQSKCVMQYQNENICIAYLTGKSALHYSMRYYIFSKPVIHLSCANHRNFGWKIEDVYCNIQGYDQWLKMEPKSFQKNIQLLHFNVQLGLDRECREDFECQVNFDIKVVSTIGNYYYEIMENAWLTDFWAAAINQKLTDVEIFVGAVKVMEAHRVILCARSSVLKASLSKINNARKSIVTFEAEFNVEIVKHFLDFLYTGSLKTRASQQLSKMATMYEVETLKNVCQPIADPPDAEELTNYLLQL